MAVRANSIMPPSDSNAAYSLFLPRFVEDFSRPDKVLADSLAEVQDQFAAAMEGA
jgi:DNA ligase-1